MRKRHNKGFTLIEIMIAVAIVAIMAAIGYPSYTDHVRKARRADGTGALLNAAHNLERCGSTFGRYNHGNCDIFTDDDTSAENYYLITSENVTASTYTFRAVAQNQQVGDAAKCNNFTLDQAGTKGASGSEGVDRCWNN